MRTMISGVALALALVAGTNAQAAAYDGDRVPRAAHGMLGTTVVNTHTKVHTTLIGWYKYPRVKHGHRIMVRGIVVSAQRCWAGECHGPAKEGRLWSPTQWGHAPGDSRGPGPGGPQAGAAENFCLVGSAYCAAPWNWVQRWMSAPLVSMYDNVTKPCVAGTFGGWGFKVADRLGGVMAMAEGTLTTAEKAARVIGPEGYAAAGYTGCFVGVAARGFTKVRSLVHALNPLDRSVRHGR